LISRYFIIFLIFIYSASTQESIYETLTEDEEDRTGNEYLLYWVEYYRDNPLVLQKARIYQLTFLPFMDKITARKIKKYVREFKPKNIEQISNYLDLTDEQRYVLENCTVISVEKHFSLFTKSRIKYNFGKIDGITREKYRGDAIQSYQSVSSRYDGFQLSGLLKKNQGERSFSTVNKWNLGYLAEDFGIILGNQNINMGFGGLFANSFPNRVGFGGLKLKYRTDIRPATSSFEYGSMYGIGSYFSHKISDLRVKYLISAGENRRPATLKPDGTISSYYLSGYYRTETEYNKIDAFREKYLVLSADISSENFVFGLNSLYLGSDKYLNTANFNYMRGRQGLFYSAHGKYEDDELRIGLESGADYNGYPFALFGISQSEKLLKLDFNLRYLSPNLRLPYSNLLSSKNQRSNEFGLSFESKIKLYQNLETSFLADYFTEIQRIDFWEKKSGLILANKTNYEFTENQKIIFYFRIKDRDDDYKNYDENRQGIVSEKKYNARFELRSTFFEQIQTKIRTESVFADSKKGKFFGNMLSFGLNWNVNDDLLIGGKFTIFVTDDSEAALWQYEYFAPSAISVPILNGDGYRSYFKIRYKWNGFEFNLRYSEQFKYDVEEIGSSYNAVLGNRESNLFFQLNYRY
jgi:hypothetical protein